MLSFASGRQLRRTVGAVSGSGSRGGAAQLFLAAPLYVLQPSQKAADSLGVGLVSKAHTLPPLLLHLLLLLLLGAGHCCPSRGSGRVPRMGLLQQPDCLRASVASARTGKGCLHTPRMLLSSVPLAAPACLPACLPAAVLAMPSRMRCEPRCKRYYGQLVI